MRGMSVKNLPDAIADAFGSGGSPAMAWLGENAERNLREPRTRTFLSAAGGWEVAIKRSLGKLQAPDRFASTYLDAGAEPLPITLDHAAAVEVLPWHHRDPFDRMLVAQVGASGFGGPESWVHGGEVVGESLAADGQQSDPHLVATKGRGL